MWKVYDRLDTGQREKLAAYHDLLLSFNRRINLISREDEADVEGRHIRHVLALLYNRFPENSVVVDWGTGGGLPAIPLAICFPEIKVYAVDAVGKKIHAVQAMGRRLGLSNLHAWHGRAETFADAFPEGIHYSVSRATAPLADLWRWHAAACTPRLPEEGAWRPGLVCLKGGDLSDEKAALCEAAPDLEVRTIDLHNILGGDYFAEKHIVEVFSR